MTFPKQTEWVYPWPGNPRQAAADMASVGTGGVLLSTVIHHTTWRSGVPRTAAKRSAAIAAFRAAGVQPYMWAYLYHLDKGEADAVLAAFHAHPWAGIILDLEGEWESFARSHPAQAAANLEAFMKRVRPVTSFLAYAPYWKPDAHNSYRYSDFNRWCDAVMPQLYIGGFYKGSDAGVMLKRMADSFAIAGRHWAHQPRAIYPVDDPYGTEAAWLVKQTTAFRAGALARYGHVSWWRYPFKPGIRAVFRGPKAHPAPGPDPVPVPTPSPVSTHRSHPLLGADLRAAPTSSAPVLARVPGGIPVRAARGRTGESYQVGGSRSLLWLEVSALDGHLVDPPLWSPAVSLAALRSSPSPSLPPVAGQASSASSRPTP